MAAKSGRRAKPKKVKLKGCVNYKGGKLKMVFSSLKEGDDWLKKIQQFDVKQSYECDICGKIHVGRRLSGKSNDRSRQTLQVA